MAKRKADLLRTACVKQPKLDEQCFFDSLPDELLVKILLHLKLQERLTLERCCQRFHLLMPYGNLGVLNLGEFSTKDYRSPALFDCLQRKLHDRLVNIDGISLKAYPPTGYPKMPPYSLYLHELLNRIKLYKIVHLDLERLIIDEVTMKLINESFPNLAYLRYYDFIVYNPPTSAVEVIDEFFKNLKNLKHLHFYYLSVASCLPSSLETLHVSVLPINLEALLATCPHLRHLQILSETPHYIGLLNPGIRVPYLTKLETFSSELYPVTTLLYWLSQRCPNIKHLDLRNNHFAETINESAIEPLRSLKKLVLHRLTLDNVNFLHKFEPANLEYLEIDNIPSLSDTALELSAIWFSNLGTLICKNCEKVTCRSLRAIMQHCMELQHLDFEMQSCSSASMPDSDLPRLSLTSRTKLESCVIKRCQCEDVLAIVFVKCPNLTRLSITETDMSSVTQFDELSHLQTLSLLDIEGDVSLMLETIRPINLEHVKFDHIFSVTDAVIASVADKAFHNLKTLHIEACRQLKGSSLQEVFMHCHKLQTLDILHCHITDTAGFAGLAFASSTFTKLRILRSDKLKPTACMNKLLKNLATDACKLKTRPVPLNVVSTWYKHWFPQATFAQLTSHGFLFVEPNKEEQKLVKQWKKPRRKPADGGKYSPRSIPKRCRMRH